MDTALILGISAIVALAITLWRPSSKAVKYLTTLFHEVGHAVVALILGGHIQRIRIEADGSGATGTAHAIRLRYKLVRIIELLAGYSFPVNVGTALIMFSWIGVEPLYLLIFTGLVALFALIFIRNLFGLLVIVIYASLIGASFLLQGIIPISYPMAVIGFLLFFVGIKDIKNVTSMNLQKMRNPENKNDFQLLKDETFIPALVWNILFIIGQAAAILGIVFLINYYAPSLVQQ